LRSIVGQAQGELGAFDRALRNTRESARLAELRGRALDRAYAYRGLATVYVRQGRIAQAMSVAERGLELATATGIGVFMSPFAGQLAYVHALAGNLDRVPELVAQVEAATAAHSVTHGHTLAVLWSAEALLRTGQIEAASALARSAAEYAARSGQRGYGAWATWLIGEIATHNDQDDAGSAAAHYHEAFSEATRLRMRPLVAHCHLGLAKLYRLTGKHDQAQEHLAVAATMYREMDMRFYLAQAEAEPRALA
jgi:tetratricopeptide (TPR) repeat protein